MATTRDRIVTAAAEQLRVGGYHSLSVKAVLGAAGATVGSMYHFFPGGKVELVDLALEATGDVYRQLLSAIADGAANPADAVEQFFDGAADALEGMGYLDVCPIGGVAREVASTDERLRQRAESVFGSWIAELEHRLVADGIDQTTATELAEAAVAAIEGGFVVCRTQRNTRALRTSGRILASAIRTAERASAYSPGGPSSGPCPSR